MGALGWIAMGCGALIVIIVVVGVAATLLFGPQIKKYINEAGPKLKQLGEEAKTNPTKAAADSMLQFSGGLFEMAAEDDVNKRYTVREKRSGQLTTFYWDAKAGKPKSVPGDFSAIPADAKPPAQ